MTIIIAILIFGFLIFIHELGHYLTARMFKVGINEFALGMGPKIFSWTSKKTNILYSLRLLPIGGYVSMVGEDEDSEDKNALNNKPVWQRMIIVSAGAFMNVLVGILTVFIIVVSSNDLGSNIVSKLDRVTELTQFGVRETDTIVQIGDDTVEIDYNKAMERLLGYSEPTNIAVIRDGERIEFENVRVLTPSKLRDYGVMEGDRIVKIGDQDVHIDRDLVEAIMFEGKKPVDVTVIRNGEKVVLDDVCFARDTENGMVFGVVDFYVSPAKKSFTGVLKHTYYYSMSTVSMIWKSLVMLVTGDVGVEQMSGPIGVTSAIGDAVKLGPYYLLNLVALLALNLGIFNMLPLPALDGGRFVFMLYELIFRKPVKREVEGMIHFVGLMLLLVLMAFVCFNDVRNLF
ncbi:MAG: RIP metalloprotease RseP [Clostridia bacterium]|nr:RIP metalloprotease RseP [Clostridia bacterium]